MRLSKTTTTSPLNFFFCLLFVAFQVFDSALSISSQFMLRKEVNHIELTKKHVLAKVSTFVKPSSFISRTLLSFGHQMLNFVNRSLLHRASPTEWERSLFRSSVAPDPNVMLRRMTSSLHRTFISVAPLSAVYFNPFSGFHLWCDVISLLMQVL